MPAEHIVEVVCCDRNLAERDKNGKLRLARIMCWVCPGCDRVMDWEFGCAHDSKEESALCDDCWCAKFGSKAND